MRILVQVREIIADNINDKVISASNPSKALDRLQREIEEALISLAFEITKAERKKSVLKLV